MGQVSFSDDAKNVVKAIQDSVETAVLKINGEEFITNPVFLPPEKPDVKTLQISSLGGLVEYLNQKVDGHNPENLLILVYSPKTVQVFKQIDSRKDIRTCFIEATYDPEGFPFDRFIDQEQFMVKAQSLIEDNLDQSALLKFIGNLTTQLVQTSSDDGVTQNVVVEQGVRKSEIKLPNPVAISPRRTFAEIDQPSSTFVLRLQQSREGQMPQIGLFEADGGFWKIAAIESIKKYLQENLKVKVPIIG